MLRSGIEPAGPLLPTRYMTLLMAGGTAWSLAFVLFALRYGPMLLRRRAD